MVDDEPDVIKITRMILDDFIVEGAGLELLYADSGNKAIRIFEETDDIAVLLLDVVMETDDAGLRVVKIIRNEKHNKLVRIILRTGQPSMAPEIDVIRDYDISDYKEKSDLTAGKLHATIYSAIKSYRDMKQLVEYGRQLREMNRLLNEKNISLRHKVDVLQKRDSIIGASTSWRAVINAADQVKNGMSNVLLLGESGTGKEVVAQYIHENGLLREKPFITVNCAAFSDSLFESELFGHKKGSFAGALTDRKGVFEEADGGTLLLDEIGDMSLEMQAKLLRAIQFGEVKRVGENRARKVKVRIISSTNKNLRKEIKKGGFREDLYHRISVFPIHLPPLRSRKDDIPLLIQYLLRKFSAAFKKRGVTISPEVIRAISQGQFPGNVRELGNEIERLINLVSPGQEIDMDLYKMAKGFQPPADDGEEDVTLPDIHDDEFNYKAEVLKYERRLIQKAIELTDGNKAKASELLKISKRTLFEKLSRQ